RKVISEMKKARNIPFLAVVAATLSFIGVSAIAGDNHAGEVAKERSEATLSKECITPKAYEQINACPEGPKKFGGKARHRKAFKSAPPPSERKKRNDNLAPKNASESMMAGQRDTRK